MVADVEGRDHEADVFGRRQNSTGQRDVEDSAETARDAAVVSHQGTHRLCGEGRCAGVTEECRSQEGDCADAGNDHSAGTDGSHCGFREECSADAGNGRHFVREETGKLQLQVVHDKVVVAVVYGDGGDDALDGVPNRGKGWHTAPTGAQDTGFQAEQ